MKHIMGFISNWSLFLIMNRGIMTEFVMPSIKRQVFSGIQNANKTSHGHNRKLKNPFEMPSKIKYINRNRRMAQVYNSFQL